MKEKILAVVFAVLILPINLFSCGIKNDPDGGSDKSSNEQKIDQVEEAVSSNLEISDEIKSAAEINDGAKIRLNLSENTTAEVIEIDGNTARLSITAPDMKKILSQILSEDAVFDDEEKELDRIKDYVAKKLASGNFETLTKEVTVEIETDGDGFRIIENDEYYDAVYGGMLSYYDEIAEEQSGK